MAARRAMVNRSVVSLVKGLVPEANPQPKELVRAKQPGRVNPLIKVRLPAALVPPNRQPRVASPQQKGMVPSDRHGEFF